MKKFLTLMLAGALSLSVLTACGDEEPAKEDVEVKEDVTVEEDVVEEDADVEEDAVEEETEAEADFLEVPAYIANATGADIREIYLSVAGEDNWGENLLADDEYLPSGALMPLTLTLVSQEDVKWDLMVADPEGATIEWYDIDISEMPTDGFAIELMWDGETATAGLAETPDDLQGDYEE